MTVLGIDIGGSGIKGAPVDIEAGALADERFRLETPRPATPTPWLAALAEVAGTGRGTTRWVSPSPAWSTTAWSQTPRTWTRAGSASTPPRLFTDSTGRPRHRAQRRRRGRVGRGRASAPAAGVDGVVMLLTFGTGIGSALFVDGKLVPNTEFGHLELDGADAELRASDRIREDQGLQLAAVGRPGAGLPARASACFSPDLIILGGGVSKKADRFLPLRQVATPGCRPCCRTTPASSARRWPPPAGSSRAVLQAHLHRGAGPQALVRRIPHEGRAAVGEAG